MILNFIRVLFSRNHQSLNDGYWCLLVSLWYEGTFPEWLEGTLIRNGPGLYTFGETEMKHVFDGMALLHRFQITDNGKVCQRSFSEMIARRNRAPFYWNICPESLSVKTLEIIYFTRLLFFSVCRKLCTKASSCGAAILRRTEGRTGSSWTRLGRTHTLILAPRSSAGRSIYRPNDSIYVLLDEDLWSYRCLNAVSKSFSFLHFLGMHCCSCFENLFTLEKVLQIGNSIKKPTIIMDASLLVQSQSLVFLYGVFFLMLLKTNFWCLRFTCNTEVSLVKGVSTSNMHEFTQLIGDVNSKKWLGFHSLFWVF